MQTDYVLDKIRQCNVTYSRLGVSDRSAMPIGNGELAASVWMDSAGVLRFYLSRTDALSECDRTVKLGLWEVRFSPNPFVSTDYKQELLLDKGRIRISSNNAELNIYIEAKRDVFRISGEFKESVTVTTTCETWRTKPYYPEGEFIVKASVYESSDIIEYLNDKILLYHKNGSTIIKELALLQSIDDISVIPDLLANRIFGSLTSASPASSCISDVIESKDTKSYLLYIATRSEQERLEDFISELSSSLSASQSDTASMTTNDHRWQEFWVKSYIFVEGDIARENNYKESLNILACEPTEYTCGCKSQITRAYLLTRYMHACCNRGRLPMLYNGMLFNLAPGEEMHFTIDHLGAAFTAQPGAFSSEFNPDERSWCTEQLWQNLRLPYYSLAARGEAESMKVLFQYYRRFWELNRYRAKRYYQADGQHSTEMTLSFGLQSSLIYGSDRTNLSLGYAENRWGGAIDVSPGLELAAMMLDYFDFCKDEVFLREEVLIYISDLLRYIETRFPRIKPDGKMSIGPLNSLETYRDTTNPIPVVAGLHNVLHRVLNLDKMLVDEYDYFEAYSNKIPPIPVEIKNLKTLLAPAETYENERFNVEIPELHAVFPFRLCAKGTPSYEQARDTYAIRISDYNNNRSFKIGDKPDAPSFSGWQTIGVAGAVLGLADEAGNILEQNCALQNPGTRFPAMWGPIYDAVPDNDHGSNILNQLQLMVMQTVNQKIYILPAFPEKWNVEFLLFADQNTSIECCYRNGRLLRLKVVPESRLKDVIFGEYNVKTVHISND